MLLDNAMSRTQEVCKVERLSFQFMAFARELAQTNTATGKALVLNRFSTWWDCHEWNCTIRGASCSCGRPRRLDLSAEIFIPKEEAKQIATSSTICQEKVRRALDHKNLLAAGGREQAASSSAAQQLGGARANRWTRDADLQHGQGGSKD
jgi:hypothetical protein